MFDLNVRWRKPLPGPVSTAPVKMRDLTIIRQMHLLHAYDESGRHIWTREIADGPEDGELAANDELVCTTYTIEITDSEGEVVCSQTRFDFFDEGSEHVGTELADGTMRNGGLVVHGRSLHAWMNDGGIALRRRRFDIADELSEAFVPFAQPWDANITKRGVVLVGFTGRREGACLWNPRTQAMAALVEDTDVWSHGVNDQVAVFAIGADEANTTLVAMDLQTREELWRREDTTRGIAVCDHGVLVYLGGQDRIPAMLDLDTGDILWMATSTHRGFSWDIIGGIALSRGRRTVAFELASGRRLGEAAVQGVVEFEDYFVAVGDGELVAFEYPVDVAEESQPHIAVPSVRSSRRGRIPTPVLTDRWEQEVRRA